MPERSEGREELVPTSRRPITLDASDRILWEGHHGITFGNPEHYAYVTLHPSHEDFWVPVGGTIIP